MAWMRALLPVAALAALASCGGGSSARLVDPLGGDGSLAAGGSAVGSVSPNGVEIHFVESSLFGIGLVYRNTSKRSLTVVGAEVVPPLHSIVRQVGTTLTSWNPPPCPPHVLGCPVRRSFDHRRPRPVRARWS